MKISLDHPERDVRRSPAVRRLLLEIENRLRPVTEPEPAPGGQDSARAGSGAGAEFGRAYAASAVPAYRDPVAEYEDDQGRTRTRSSAVSG